MKIGVDEVWMTWFGELAACQEAREWIDCLDVFFLKHIFHLRERMQITGADEEKPFLDHLEDLRTMILRMAICLVITTVVSFEFATDLMDIIRKPADEVWTTYENAHLPAGITTEEWGEAKTLAYVLPGLPEKARLAIEKKVSGEKWKLAESALLLRAARQLPEAEREAFFKEASSNEGIARLSMELERTGAVITEGTGRGALKLMGAFQPGEPFMLSIKLAFYAGLVISFPFLMYFLLQFIVPGLLENERKLLYKSLFIGFGLFLTGVGFCYWVVLPRVLTFFYMYSLDFGIANEWRIGYYISFATQLVLMFGIGFELPVVVMPFVKMGLLSYELMKSTRRYAIVAITVLAAFITPTPDIPTMMLMAVPMYVLYEVCILLAWRESRRRAKEDAEAYARMEHDYGIKD
ncbi:twin-arginine translocase subunit TatC [Akkermansia sp. N21116]|uniref:twin-arginine translocase subunit TatC n=1 Tax=Akkermansia sp. N21116 TaxID=3040764 RepID=UPI00244EF83E|nr:twin-arginine translocase subunit TatC [Akkermansia sp. N21116]WPX41461.1 twin-arginine translocase subunit TatC [Akkermansia sp. N21116]